MDPAFSRELHDRGNKVLQTAVPVADQEHDDDQCDAEENAWELQVGDGNLKRPTIGTPNESQSSWRNTQNERITNFGELRAF